MCSAPESFRAALRNDTVLPQIELSSRKFRAWYEIFWGFGNLLGRLFLPGVGVELVDPDFVCESRWCWRFADEAFGMGGVGGVKDPAAGRDDSWGAAVVDVAGGHQRDAGVLMSMVVPAEGVTD